MTKIIFLTHSAAPAGAELALLASFIAYQGNESLSVVFGEEGDVVGRFDEAGLAHTVLPIGGNLSSARRRGSCLKRFGQVRGVFRYARQLRKHLKSEHADVVVARSLKSAVYGRVATWGTGVTFVWCLHDRMTKEYVGWSAPLWSTLMSNLVDGIVVNSRSTLSTIRRRGGVKVLVLPPSIAFDVRTAELEDGPLRVLCLGRLAPWKGQENAIRAFKASLYGTGATLTIAGGPLFDEHHYEERLQRLVTDLALWDAVDFVGHVDDPVALMVEHDVLVHSSIIPEPFGLVVLEAMRAGLVVIASDRGGPSEVVETGESGLLVDTRDVDAIAHGLERVVGMSLAQRRQITASAQKRVRSYDPEGLVSDHVKWLVNLKLMPAALPKTQYAGPWRIDNRRGMT